MRASDTEARNDAVASRLDLLLLHAAAHGSRPAVTSGSLTLSYTELLGQAYAVAVALRARGAAPGTFVAVGVDRSLESLVGMLGVVLSGAAYVPVDAAAPLERAVQIVEQAEVHLLTGAVRSVVAALPQLEVVPCAGAQAPPPPPAAVRPADAAYAIFTSGSTGHPKGVVVPHRAVVNSTNARFTVFPHADMRYVMLAPLTFDAAVAGVYFTLAAGGHLVLPTAEEATDPGLVIDLVRRHAATHLDGVPSQYAAVLECGVEGLAGLTCVVVAGEALAQGLVKRHEAGLPDVALFNEYGPTEGTVWSTVYRCDAKDEGPYAPIGRPVDGVQVTLVDEQLEPVPPGVEGEIVVSGRQLARCYLGQPGQTADRFVPHPDGGGARRYRTGDRGRLNADGDIVYLGRMDAMVKVRGFRVEPSEVEGWLRMQPEVSDAVVLPEQVAGTVRLVAVLVPVAGESGLAPLLRGRLAQHLPAYCIPTVWREVGCLPLTPHGKTDRAAAAALHATLKRPTTPHAREATHG